MSKVFFSISASLDGFVAGPDMKPDQGLGRGGEQLHEWVVDTEAFQRLHGRSGGVEGAASDILDEVASRTGAHIMGRRMFGGEGPWDNPAWGTEPWPGWWGDEPPFRGSVFVLTHHEREPLVLGETTFTFVTDGIESALEQARPAAGEKDVQIAGGADAIQQYLRAGLVDEFQVHVAPVFLGEGVRLFDGVGDVRVECTEVLRSPAAAHLRYRVL